MAIAKLDAPGAQALLDRFLAGDRAALARLITRAEDRDPEFLGAIDSLYTRVGRGLRIGITGPPGSGKSTIVDGLAHAYRVKGELVAVLAVDPSSPFTGGALLGDRIRMRTAEEDPSVFVRSMATRGSLGGLARASMDAADLLDAFGFTRILLETVGVGQAEHDVVSAADCVVVVLNPGGGDSVQAMKAGLMEIAEVFVANKFDQPGSDRLVDDIEQMLELRARAAWRPQIVPVVATERKGIDTLTDAIARCLEEKRRSGTFETRRVDARRSQILRLVEEEVRAAILEHPRTRAGIDAALAAKRAPHGIASEVSTRLRAALDAAPGEKRNQP